LAEPAGIGGWLVLVALGQIFGPVRTVVNFATYYGDKTNQAVFGTFPVAMYGELVLNISYVLLVFFTTYTFFATKRIFKIMFTIEFAANIMLVAFDAAWIAIATSIAIDGSKIGADFARAIGAAIWGIVWIPYIWMSKRARNTFVN